MGIDLTDPFKRLVASGLRLNQLRSEPALHDALVDEAAELSGAERVLLVLRSAEKRHIAGALLPAGEDAAPLLQAVTPWLDEAADTQEPKLRHGPEGAAEKDQRSCLVAPLVAQGQLLGWLYADIEGAFGRFRDADRDLLAMLAGLRRRWRWPTCALPAGWKRRWPSAPPKRAAPRPRPSSAPASWR